MANLLDVLEEATKLNQRIQQLLKLSTYNESGDLIGLDMDLSDPEQIFLWTELWRVMESLAYVDNQISYLNCPIQEVSRLHRNGQGNYETASGHCCCCGSFIEALVTDENHCGPYWTRAFVGHDGMVYYQLGKSISMNGLTVRVRSMPH